MSFNHGQTPEFSSRLIDSGAIRMALGLLVLVAFAIRLTPLLDFNDRLFWQFVTEDGYLMQTIARNMALGLGMSTAEGTMPSNGVQPLATFIYAGLHYLAGGSKLWAIVYLTILLAIVAMVTAYLLRILALKLLNGKPYADDLSIFFAVLWLASPFVIGHGMNGLETGIYYLSIVSTLVYYFSVADAGGNGMRSRERLTLGVLLGVTFLARNDAVFFIAALLTAHVAVSGNAGLAALKNRIMDAMVAGALSIVVASPWLIHNYARFGSIIPQSGTSQSAAAALGENLRMIPANWFEAAFLYIPIPRSLETHWLAVFGASLALAAMVWQFWRHVVQGDLIRKRFMVLALLVAAGVGGYYGLFFGAAHFVSRYLSSLAPMLWFMTFSSIFVIINRHAPRPLLPKFALFLPVLVLLLVSVRFVHDDRSGTSQMHRQVVDWVKQNVDETVWVGAPQTGTLGYFHDRTINLDGKVNPAALQARLQHNQVLTYVLDESPVIYIADWAGVCDWLAMNSEPRFGYAFEQVVLDKKNNLCVMKRV